MAALAQEALSPCGPASAASGGQQQGFAEGPSDSLQGRGGYLIIAAQPPLATQGNQDAKENTCFSSES